jgi:hypothetical protein
MARKGLVYYLVLNVPIFMGVAFYLTSKNTINKTLKIYENQEEFYKKMENKPKIVTDKEIRHTAERQKIKEVPLSDVKDGYM